MIVCFYIARYLIMHLNTWFNRKRVRCCNGCYVCSPTHSGASSLWTRIYGLLWFCLLSFLCCGALCFTFVFVQFLSEYPQLLLWLTPYWVLEHSVHTCVILESTVWTHGNMICLCFIIQHATIARMHLVYCALVIPCTNCSGLSDRRYYTNLHSGTDWLIHRVHYWEKFCQRRRVCPRTRHYIKQLHRCR